MVTLHAREMTLRLRIVNELKWCSVDLEADGHTYNLGADSLGIVCSRLAKALSVPLGMSNAHAEPRWVTSFSEEHCTILALNVPNGVELQFQNADGHRFYRGLLSDDEIEEWRGQLANNM
jgi:hypothetical protein